MRPLDEWDADYLDEVAPMEETATLEKKAAEGLTPKKLAQGVCAFANSGDGFMVFGMREPKDGGGMDDGVPANKGRQSIKDWVEALIPTLHQPPIEGCEARFIQNQTHHQPDRGVLVVSVPLSERRPHWTKDGEKSYLRSGAHSYPMPMQTFADMLTRGFVPRVDVADLGLALSGEVKWHALSQFDGPTYPFKPVLALVAGPVCETWACEIRETGKSAFFILSGLSLTMHPTEGKSTWFIPGEEPIFPGRETPVVARGLDLRLCVPQGVSNIEIAVRIYAASAAPVERRFPFLVDDVGLHPA